MGSSKSVLIFGGAGFVGSAMARKFSVAGNRVTVVDGLFEETGGSRDNLAGIEPPVTLIPSSIENVPDVAGLLSEHELIIDAMAWTSHLQSLQDPMYDLRLNAQSHLSLLVHLREKAGLSVIYLGSRNQFGNPDGGVIDGTTPMIPEDIQGIHKVAAESYYRVFARNFRLSVSAVRFPNCYGPGQKTTGNDIGLIGAFIRDALAGRDIEIFGNGRKRSLVFAPDVAEIVYRLGGVVKPGFSVFNIPGRCLTIEDLARLIVDLVGRGRVIRREMPENIRAVDVGEAILDGTSLRAVLEPIPQSDLERSLAETIDYFRRRIQ